MAKYQQFGELPVWQESTRLYHRVLELLEEPNTPVSPAFKSQLERAALTMSARVVESFSSVGKEAVACLLSARAASAEVQAMAAVAAQRPKLARQKESHLQVQALAESCSRQLSGWMYALEHPNKNRPSPAVAHAEEAV